MSNRSNAPQSNNRRFPSKAQMKFVPKTPNTQSTSTPANLKPQTLSSSLRTQSPSDGFSMSTASNSSSSRVRLGDTGEWAPIKGNFVNYLPQDEAVAVGLGADQGGFDPVESQRVVDLLNRELSRLLLLKPRDFWQQVASDSSLHEFLDSFVQFRSRWYDFPYHAAKGTVAGVIVGDMELSSRVFMVLYRISSNKDPGARATECLSKKDHEVLLQEKKILELPKLLDICALYGHDNEELTRRLVLNAVNAQPNIPKSLTATVSHFLGIFHTMFQRCRISLEVLTSGGGFDDHGYSQRHVEYLEVMDFLNDAVASMDRFVCAYSPAAAFFSCPVDAGQGNEELINTLATVHDSLLPLLQHGLQIVLADKEKSMFSDVSASIRILSARIVDLGWKLMDACYLGEEVINYNHLLPAATKMFPASVEDPVIRADILVQTLKEIAAFSQSAQTKSYGVTYLQSMEKRCQILCKIQRLQEAGWLLMDDEQYQYLAGILAFPISTMPNISGKAPCNIRNNAPLLIEDDAAVVESRISQVKDLFPDYGKGFISACLEVYDNKTEEVIQRILEGTLHEDLQSLDVSLETLPHKPSPPVTKKDKGKGILVAPEGFPTTDTMLVSKKPTCESNSSSASALPNSGGRFIRKSRGDQHDDNALGSKDEKHMEKTAALLSQYEYEDEYDDSFDDLGLTIVESGVEEGETFGERIRTNTSISSRGGSTSTTSTNGKWNSRKKPQFYVKDGKNYSYKVEGSVAVADEQQASLVTQAQRETIHGLGRGGNRPLGAVMKLEQQNAEKNEPDPSEVGGGGNAGRGRGRGRGRRGGGGRNHYQKDRAMKKHFAGLGGY